MKNLKKIVTLISLSLLLAVFLFYFKFETDFQEKSIHPKIGIILGSTRQGRTSEKIGLYLKNLIDKRSDTIAEIIDLRDYNLPFLYSPNNTVDEKDITDPYIKKWSKKIKAADAFIIIVPEYNAGYPGVLKNALDLLYKEWNKKLVGFIGYAGGPSGGKSAVEQLRQVCISLKMIPVFEINIPKISIAFDTKNKFVNKNIDIEFSESIDKILQSIKQQ